MATGVGMELPIMHDSDRYDFVRDIGSGNFGVARLMRDKHTKELVAVKYIERGDKVRINHIFSKEKEQTLQFFEVKGEKGSFFNLFLLYVNFMVSCLLMLIYDTTKLV